MNSTHLEPQSRYRMRRTASLAILVLLATSLVSGRGAEMPAYGLSDAGFVDGIPLHLSNPQWGGAIIVDSTSNRVLLGTTPGQSFINPVTRRAYYPPFGWEEHNGPSCVWADLAAKDIDSLQAVQPISAPSQTCYDGDYWAVDTTRNRLHFYDRSLFTLQEFDAISHSPIGQPVFITDTLARHEAFNLQSRRLTLLEWPLAIQPWPPPLKTLRLWSVNIDAKSIAADATLDANYPCRAAANPATNRIYILNEEPGQVIVIDEASLTEISRIPVAPHLGIALRSRDMCAIAINPATNRIYLLRADGPQYVPPSYDEPTATKLVVIDGDTNQVVEEFDIADKRAAFHSNIAVDPATSRIFVGVPTQEHPNRVQVFVDATEDTIQNVQQTGRYTQWFFAEGTTRPGFRTFLTLYSPDVPNRVRISYVTGPGQGGPFFQEVDLPANTRITLDVGAVTGPGRDVSTRIVSLYDKSFFAERPMYFDSSANIGTGATTSTGQHN